MAKTLKNIITRKKYLWLKGMNPEKLAKEEIKQIENYEKANAGNDMYQQHKGYWDKVWQGPEERIFNLTYPKLEKAFIGKFEEMYGPFDKSNLNLVKTVLYYFCEDKRFFKQNNLVKTLKNRSLNHNFNKGIWLIGDYGTGKSSTMMVLQELFKNTPYSFKKYSAKDVVEHYESFGNKDRESFLKRLENNRVYFDDLKTERLTNNYGVKFNVMDHVLFKRDENRVKTFISCNYHTMMPGNIEESIYEFAEIYSPQVLDRMIGMFNIIEFKGKSMRL